MPMKSLLSADINTTFVTLSYFAHFNLNDEAGVYSITNDNFNVSFYCCNFQYNTGKKDNAGIYSESRILRILCTTFYMCNATRPDPYILRGGTCICDLSSNSDIKHVSTDCCSKSDSYASIFMKYGNSRFLNTSRQLQQTSPGIAWCSALAFWQSSKVNLSIVFNCTGETVFRNINEIVVTQVWFVSCNPRNTLIYSLKEGIYNKCVFIKISKPIVTSSNYFNECIFDKVNNDPNIQGSTIIQADVKVIKTDECPNFEVSCNEGKLLLPLLLAFLNVNLSV